MLSTESTSQIWGGARVDPEYLAYLRKMAKSGNLSRPLWRSEKEDKTLSEFARAAIRELRDEASHGTKENARDSRDGPEVR